MNQQFNEKYIVKTHRDIQPIDRIGTELTDYNQDNTVINLDPQKRTLLIKLPFFFTFRNVKTNIIAIPPSEIQEVEGRGFILDSITIAADGVIRSIKNPNFRRYSINMYNKVFEKEFLHKNGFIARVICKRVPNSAYGVIAPAPEWMPEGFIGVPRKAFNQLHLTKGDLIIVRRFPIISYHGIQILKAISHPGNAFLISEEVLPFNDGDYDGDQISICKFKEDETLKELEYHWNIQKELRKEFIIDHNKNTYSDSFALQDIPDNPLKRDALKSLTVKREVVQAKCKEKKYMGGITTLAQSIALLFNNNSKKLKKAYELLRPMVQDVISAKHGTKAEYASISKRFNLDREQIEKRNGKWDPIKEAHQTKTLLRTLFDVDPVAIDLCVDAYMQYDGKPIHSIIENHYPLFYATLSRAEFDKALYAENINDNPVMDFYKMINEIEERR